ncbi:MAG: diacylglycerol kinase family lipid kinase [Christensenellaceae bacterium]|jgi:YegS/Rv2252/BmrU family lipid kinase|nr:diacylglycerol kinase family lipid kinase [Christensenellaceae bacterium]
MFDIIINPVSSSGKSLDKLKLVESTLSQKGIAYTVHMSNYAGHTTEIIKELNQKEHSEVIIMGGDGTFSEALTGITNFDTITLGYIPCGTGNDYARASKLSTDTLTALDVILKNNPNYADYIEINGNRRCINCAGAGMDVDVLVRYASLKKFKGKIRYYVALLDTLLHLKFHKVRFTIDDEVTEKSVFLITIANGTCIGGGMPISPLSDPFDGYFNLVYVNEIPKRQVLPLLLKFLKGKHLSNPATVTLKAKEILVEVLDTGKIEIDGEVLSEKILDCKLISGKLRLYQ